MEYAFRGETLTPSQCGRMDQACAFGRPPVSLTFDGDLLHVEQLPLQATLFVVIVDLMADKDTATILQSLRVAYTRSDDTPVRFLPWPLQYACSVYTPLTTKGFDRKHAAVGPC